MGVRVHVRQVQLGEGGGGGEEGGGEGGTIAIAIAVGSERTHRRRALVGSNSTAAATTTTATATATGGASTTVSISISISIRSTTAATARRCCKACMVSHVRSPGTIPRCTKRGGSQQQRVECPGLAMPHTPAAGALPVLPPHAIPSTVAVAAVAPLAGAVSRCRRRTLGPWLWSWSWS